MRKTPLFVMFLFGLFFLSPQTSIAQTKNDNIFWGIFEEGIQSNISLVNNYGTTLGKKPTMVMWYVQWQSTGDHSFPLSSCQSLASAGYMPHIVWEPWLGLDDIIAGKYDSDITKFGQDIATFGKPVMIRFGHEFNGDWYPWSKNNGVIVPAATWIKAYKHVHDLITAAGGTNALWVWCPNNYNASANTQDVTTYYPGNDYVDWMGIDGYNWGTSQSWSSWTNFAGVFNFMYQKLATTYPDKPIMLGEMGCTSTGGDKASWITDMFNQMINTYPRIKAFVWFNVNKETDWRFNTDTNSTNAFKQGISDATVCYGTDALAAVSRKKLSITGSNEIVPGASGITYKVSGLYDGWKVKWTTTGTATIQGSNTLDSVKVNWGCQDDSLKCTVTRSNDVVSLSMRPILTNSNLQCEMFVKSAEINFPISTQSISHADYDWKLPQGVTFTGIEDTASIKINWGERSDTVRLTINSVCGEINLSKIIYVEGEYAYPNPANPHMLPDTIESTDFDYGGEGLAYHDTDATNSGTGSRSDEGVDTETNEEGSDIGWINAGEWMNYTIQVKKPGDYFLELREASLNGGGSMNILINKTPALSNISLPSSGSWTILTSAYPGMITLSEKDTLLTYFFNTGGFNLGRLIFWDPDQEKPSTPQNLKGLAIAGGMKLVWKKSTDNQKIKGYNVYANGEFKSFVSDSTILLTGLSGKTTYKIGITALDIQSNESDTLKGTFTTLSTGINNISEEDQWLKIYPNPVKMGQEIVITLLTAKSPLYIRLMDLQGRVIYSELSENAEVKIHTSQLGLKGVYILEAQSEKMICHKKVVIQ